MTAPSISCPLSARELAILRLMALEGLQCAGIANRLDVTASTVRQHCANAYRKLGVTHAVQALVVCFNAGWIDPMDTEIQDPTRFEDYRVTDAQRAYLAAFDRHLAAADDERELRQAKQLTDDALSRLQVRSRSRPTRDWMDGLINAMARLEDGGTDVGAAEARGVA
jgi:DNA-binding CsgD family transcriptional regulator